MGSINEVEESCLKREYITLPSVGAILQTVSEQEGKIKLTNWPLYKVVSVMIKVGLIKLISSVRYSNRNDGCG